MIGAVLLAAGRSQRMGRPKMLLPWGETTVIGQVVSVLLAAGVDDVLVVTGGAQKHVEDALDGMPVRTVFNPDFANGEMMLTLQVGLAALRSDVDAALVVLGDQPQIELAVVQSVIAAFEQYELALVVPSYQRRRGHPWLIPRIIWKDLLELKTPTTMRQFLNEHALDIHYVNVDNPSILQDLDTPDEYQRYQKS
ncbi:NTP transferase domain-containing protein [Chloroflexota bacterium]